MARAKHPLDVVAEKLEGLAEKPSAEQDASPDYWEFHLPVTGHPQAVFTDPNVMSTWGEGEGLGPDGFPCIAIPEMRLKGRGRWPDVLVAELPASWNVGFLCNGAALSVFKRFDLGSHAERTVSVRDQKGRVEPLTWLQFRNHLSRTAIDFTRSEFHLASMLGLPGSPVAVASTDDLTEKQVLAREGQLDACKRFSRIEYKKLVLLPKVRPPGAVFRLERLGITAYITAELKWAIEDAKLTGLAIRPNKRLFAPARNQ